MQIGITNFDAAMQPVYLCVTVDGLCNHAVIDEDINGKFCTKCDAEQDMDGNWIEERPFVTDRDI